MNETLTAGLRRPFARSRRARKRSVVAIICSAVLALALFVAIFGPALAPHDPDAGNLNEAFLGPSAGHPLGFDSQGRDLLSRLLSGATTSVLGPLAIVALTMIVGVGLAVVSAWRGGWLDTAIGAVMDILFAFPAILLAILVVAVFGKGLTAAAIALALAYTPYVARVIRAAAVDERARDYVAAAEVQGIGSWRICQRHLVPNLWPLLVSQATVLYAYALVDLAAVSFIGLGVQAPQADWGVMAASGQSGVLQGYPAESFSAGACIIAVVIAVNLLGEHHSARTEEAR